MTTTSAPQAGITAPSGAGLRSFVAVVGAAGLAVVTASAWTLPHVSHPAEWLAFAGMAMVAGRFAFKVPGIDTTLSVSDMFFIASAALFGPAPATVAMAADSLLIARRRGWNHQRQVFNSASTALSLWAGAQAFFWLSGIPPLYDVPATMERVAVPLACFSAVYFLLNTGLTATAMALAQGGSPFRLWRRHFPVVSLNYFASASAAFLVFLVVQYVERAGTGRGAAALRFDLHGDAVVGRTARGCPDARLHGRPPLPLDDRGAVDGHRGQGRGDQQPHPPRAAVRARTGTRPGPDGRGQPARRCRRPRCCTTPASWRCPSAS